MSPQTNSLIDASDRPTSTRYVTLAWLCAAAAIAYIQRNSLSVMESTIREEMKLSEEQMGWVFGSFFFTYSIFQIPSGWLGDRWGSRRALPFYCVSWSIATAMTVLAGTFLLESLVENAGFTGVAIFVAWEWMLLSRLFSGAAQAGIFPCASVTMTHWFSTTQRGIASGWIAAFQQVGGILATSLVGALLIIIDWRWILVLFSLPGILWAWKFYQWFRDRPEDHRAVNEQELAIIRGPAAAVKSEPETIPQNNSTPWLEMIFSPAMWWICGQQFFRGAGYIFYATWFPTFLQETRHVSVPKSGFLTSLPILGSLLGALLGGFVSDMILRKTGSRRWARQGVAITGMISCAGFIFAAYFVHNAVAAVLIISAGAFCAALAGPAGYALTIDMGGKHVATVFATMNMSGNIGAFIFPVVVPYLLKLPGGWDLVLVVFGLVYLAAALCWALLNPNGTVFEQSRYRVS